VVTVTTITTDVSLCSQTSTSLVSTVSTLHKLIINQFSSLFAEYQQDWTLMTHVNDGKEVECLMLAQEEQGYTAEACERLALALGGNVVAHRFSEHCRVHKCSNTGAGMADLK
jgi:hypothetical protein